MRYLNWDVLLFPEQSKVPLREFKTTCHVISDSDPIQIQENGPPHLTANPVNQRQLPVVTCFVPGLAHGCPFRVSLHSWHEPEVSRGTQALTSPEDSVFFEARVLLDGVYAGGLLLNNLGPWPQVIDTCSKYDKAGDQECLRFPPFHKEMLMNNWWSAGEDLGRVRVIITEGLAHGQGQPTVFRRIKNVVSFSFQHAPLAVLEDAGIAWPNAGMWYQASQQIHAPSSPPKLGATDPDAHAHSPRRRHASREVIGNAAVVTLPPRLLSQAMMPPPALRSGQTDDFNWTTAVPTQQYPGEGRKHQVPRRWGTHISTSDESMPDYSQSITPRSSRDPSLHDINVLHDGPVAQQESQFEELMAAFSPAKTSGTQAPPTSRVSSAANSPPLRLKTSGSPEVRITSFASQPRAVSITTRDAPPPSTRQSSGISMMSRSSEIQAGDKGKAQPRIQVTPANEVKGRKEGKGSDLHPASSPGQMKALTVSSARRQKSTTETTEERSTWDANDGKRKRASMTSISNILSENSDGPGSSPSRKVSKRGQQDGLSNSADSPKPPESVFRAPLGSVQNIR